MEFHEIRLPTVAEYTSAFRALEPRISEIQKRMLLLHHASPSRVISATELAKAVGYADFTAVNAQYGRLASAIAEHLDVEGLEVKLGILVDFVDPGAVSNDHYLWVLRPAVAQAIEDLGWAPRVAHLLYPDMALKKMGHEP